MLQITAPFSPAQVDLLNQNQVGVNSVLAMHPFTCRNRSDGITYNDGVKDTSKSTHGSEGGDLGILIATESGWVCPHCSYTQDWAHESMAQTSPPEIEERIASTLRARGMDPVGLLLEKADQTILNYNKLRLSGKKSVNQSTEENEKSERIWKVVPVMLASIRRRRMGLLGVTVVDKKIVAVDDTWTSLDKEKPADGVDVQMLTCDSYGVSNPGHDGYGCDAWVETRSLIDGGHYLSFGGTATHWRSLTRHFDHQSEVHVRGRDEEVEAKLPLEVVCLNNESSVSVPISLADRCVDLSDKLFELAGDFESGHASQIISMSSLLKIYSHQLEAGARIGLLKDTEETHSQGNQKPNYSTAVVDELPEPVHHIMVDGKCIGFFSLDQMLQLRLDTIEACARLMESPNNNYAQVIRKRMGI